MFLWSFSSRFEYPFPPLLWAKAERTQSEGRANPEWRQTSIIIIQKKSKIRVPLLRKKSGTTLQKASAKKVHFLCRANATSRSKVAPDNNNNNNRDETLFTPQFTVYKANAMTDSYIRPSVNCELWNAMIFGFSRAWYGILVAIK